MTRRLLTVREARDRLRVGHTTVYGLLQSGKLASVKIGSRRLVPEDAIDELIERLPPGKVRSPVGGDAA